MDKKTLAIVALITGVFLLSVFAVAQAGATNRVYASGPNVASPSNATPTSGSSFVIPTIAVPVTRRTKLEGGLPAIKPSKAAATTSGSTPAFTEKDAKQYVIANFVKIGRYVSPNSPIVVDKVQFMTMGEKNAWFKSINGWVTDKGDPNDALVCLVTVSGLFEVHGGCEGISNNDASGKRRTFKHGFIVFDALTGNFMGEGLYK